MLELPPNFKKDIAGRDTNLIPYVVIGNAGLDPDNDFSWIDGWNIELSTSQILSALPILLNIPSLKESIDISTTRYKINSVNLDISNFPYNGTRFSELVAEKSLINVECRIQWASPSARSLYIADVKQGSEAESDMLPVYFGSIRRYTHDAEKGRLVIEDQSK